MTSDTQVVAFLSLSRLLTDSNLSNPVLNAPTQVTALPVYSATHSYTGGNFIIVSCSYTDNSKSVPHSPGFSNTRTTVLAT